MFVVGLAALLEYFTGSALLLGNNISVELLIATIFIASLMPSRTWLIHFTCATTLIAIALWLAKADDPMYSFEKGFLLLLAIWASAGLSLAIRKQQEPSQARAVLIDELGLISIVLDNNLTIIRCNGALDETLQVPTGTCVGNPFLPFIRNKDREQVEKRFSELDKGSTSHFKTQFGPANESAVPVKISISASDRQFELLCQNLSTIRDAESALRVTEERLIQQLQDTPLIHMRWTPEGRIQGWNKAAEKCLGYSSAEVIGMHLTDFIEPNSVEGAGQRLRAAVDLTGSLSGITRAFHKDGSARFLRYQNDVVKGEAGDIIVIQGLGNDVTEEYRLRKAMVASQEKFSSVFHNCPDGLILIRIADRKVIDTNKTFQQLLQLQEEPEQSTEPMESWKPLQDYDSFIQSLDRREELALFETQLLKRDGDCLPVLISTRFFQLDEENCLLMIVRDATQSRREENERLELQSQLLQIQKMDSIGQLAGGVAHDVNNMVGAIQGFAELIRDKSDKQDRRYYYANQIVVSANRAADLTSNLLAFSRNTKIEAVSVNMVDIIENTQALFVQAIFPLIIVKFLHHKDHYIIEGDTGHLEAAVMNLLINARDAMPDGGTLMLKLEQIYLTQTQSQKIDPELAEGNYVRLIVRDTGCGIAEEIQDKVILPFFTTKEAGQGTGLGLSSVYGTVKSHQGAMTIESSSGQGTIMSLYFPSSEEIHATEDEIDTPFISGEGVVLIVDDEEQMRLMAQETLEHAGYKTLLATNGAEAVRLYARHRDIIDLVVLDLVMPIMNGTDTLQALRTFDSKAKVLIMTGYTSEQHRELIAQGAMAIMMKPFKQSLLCQQVDAAIKTIRLSERKHRPERLQW